MFSDNKKILKFKKNSFEDAVFFNFHGWGDTGQKAGDTGLIELNK
jgi:hypothetical protein